MRYLAFTALALLAACARAPEDSYVTEPIQEQNIYDPSAAQDSAIVTTPLDGASVLDSANDQPVIKPAAPAPVAAAPVAPEPLSDKERLVAAIEANGCVLDAANAEPILASLGIEQSRLGELGGELMNEGRVEVVPPAEFRLVTGTCAP